MQKPVEVPVPENQKADNTEQLAGEWAGCAERHGAMGWRDGRHTGGVSSASMQEIMKRLDPKFPNQWSVKRWLSTVDLPHLKASLHQIPQGYQ